MLLTVQVIDFDVYTADWPIRVHLHTMLYVSLPVFLNFNLPVACNLWIEIAFISHDSEYMSDYYSSNLKGRSGRVFIRWDVSSKSIAVYF